MISDDIIVFVFIEEVFSFGIFNLMRGIVIDIVNDNLTDNSDIIYYYYCVYCYSVYSLLLLYSIVVFLIVIDGIQYWRTLTITSIRIVGNTKPAYSTIILQWK